MIVGAETASVALAANVTAGRRPCAHRRAGDPHCFIFSRHKELNEDHIFFAFASEVMTLAVRIINKIAFAHRQRRFIRKRGPAPLRYIHEMLGAFMMVIRSLRPGRIDDHFAFQHFGTEKFRRDKINAFAGVMFGIKHRLALPVNDAELRRPHCKIGIMAHRLGNLRV